ncbi:MAG: polysaccharide deacetylase family protein [Bacteroidales bacterium]|jgi:peptidoglycan/xylan/chitin deacetylase (PgdA/CDA1 family)|nr:polysaccharide deacetylase family protein [Bacteroidales bacterium]
MKKTLFKLLRYSGLPFFFREFIQKNKVSIILFHDIDKSTTEKTFSYLEKKYNIISLDNYLEAINDNSITLPKKSLIITFDDGHIRNYEMLDVIKSKEIPVTIFLCSSIINTNRHFWFKYNHPDIITSKLKIIPNKDRLLKLKQADFEQTKEFNTPQALSKEQILEMSKWVNFQSHTSFHPCLPTCNDNEALSELADSKQLLEDEYNLNINTISYPNGDYSERDIKISKEVGYKCGITVDYGFNTIKTDIFRLKRLSVNDTNNIDELSVKASGVWAFLKTRNGKKQTFGLNENI